jgi:hypothetical protein
VWQASSYRQEREDALNACNAAAIVSLAAGIGVLLDWREEEGGVVGRERLAEW